MYLHRLFLDLRSREVRRDIADPYEMHSTLCRAFAPPEKKCPEGAFLWRLEPERGENGLMAKVIVQSKDLPEWQRIAYDRWFGEEPSKPLDINEKLKLRAINNGKKFRYRLRANPSVCRNGKRIGLFSMEEQEAWINRQGERNGFSLIFIHRSEEQMLNGKNRNEFSIKVFSVLFDGILSVEKPDLFYQAIAGGIGHGKAMGLGLLSVVPI
ncbi:MAG: type I-E CRISPR-associated protein Cas6/Cse3/CasE [Chitinivibrionales bacterium]